MTPNILSIAGSDPSGGAGIQADIKAIAANGGYAMAVITALTAQNTRGVQAVSIVAPDMIAAQIASIRADITIHAVKIGMLGDTATIDAVVAALEGLEVPIVLDPVMVAKGGDRLLEAEANLALRTRLLPLATVVTPNLPEAADLLGTEEARDTATMEAQGVELRTLGCSAVLMKGGHLKSEVARDLLVTADGVAVFEAPRVATSNTHGTGCTLSSALATHLGHRRSLAEATARAKTYISGAIAAADELNVGGGHGPLHHFYAAQV